MTYQVEPLIHETIEPNTFIYVGRRFVDESDGIMSSVYSVKGKRCDWGFVRELIRAKKSVYIRPATSRELEYFENALIKLRSKLRMQKTGTPNDT